MTITLSNGRRLRLIFNRDPHPTTRKAARQHRATRVVIVEDHDDHTHILARAEVRAHPPDVFTKEEGRVQALVKALVPEVVSGRMDVREAVEITQAYENRPRPVTQPKKRGCAALTDLYPAETESFRAMEQARRNAAA
jgi:hypothetical protein